MDAHCCYIAPDGVGCDLPALWEIAPNGAFAYTETHACTAHVGDLLGQPVDSGPVAHTFTVSMIDPDRP